MKLKIQFCIIMVFLSSFCFSQIGKEAKVHINDLYIPNAPGFVLADKAPSSIDKPSIPRAFALSLLNLSEGGAIEVTPFWLTNKPLYTFDDWVKKKNTAIETFNLSVATFKTDTNSHLSIGFRSQLFRIYTDTSAIFREKREIVKLLTNTNDQGEVIIDEDAVRKAVAELELLKNKGLFSVEIAAAVLGASDKNTFKGLASTKSGCWANIRWSPAKSSLDFIGLARYSWANNTTSKTGRDTSFFDFGLSLNYQIEKFDLSTEYVNRQDISLKKSYDRFTLVCNYALNENIILVGAIGKNFDEVDNIITVFGVKFGLSRQREK